MNKPAVNNGAGHSGANHAHEAGHEPLVRLAKRDGVDIKKKITIRALSLLLALVIDAVFIVLVTGLNPLAVYVEIFKATFATPLRFMWAKIGRAHV